MNVRKLTIRFVSFNLEIFYSHLPSSIDYFNTQSFGLKISSYLPHRLQMASEPIEQVSFRRGKKSRTRVEEAKGQRRRGLAGSFREKKKRTRLSEA